MSVKLQKFIGWVLLFGGLAIILWSLYSSYNIFTAKVEVPEIFKVVEKETVLSKKGTQDLEAQIEKIIGEQLKGILSSDFLPKIFNLIAWSIFAGILIFGGTQIAILGIKLIKQ